jgi:predicted metal-binding protein
MAMGHDAEFLIDEAAETGHDAEFLIDEAAETGHDAEFLIDEAAETGHDAEFLINEAIETGFSQAGELNVEALVFMPEVREMCSVDRCHQYGKNWRCPPACGSVEEAAERAARYRYGVLVQTIGKMEDDFDYEAIQTTGAKHKRDFAALVKKLRARYDDILPMGAGTCELCETCSYPDEPCRHPDESISSMEAYGLWVSEVCRLSGVPYNNGTRTITYTSCYLLK